MTAQCSICGRELLHQEDIHNASPFSNVCCGECNSMYVIPMRIMMAQHFRHSRPIAVLFDYHYDYASHNQNHKIVDFVTPKDSHKNPDILKFSKEDLSRLLQHSSSHLEPILIDKEDKLYAIVSASEMREKKNSNRAFNSFLHINVDSQQNEKHQGFFGNALLIREERLC